MADIFVSYASDNRERVRPIAEGLETENFSVWWDEELRAGNKWPDTIERQLRAAHCVIVVWSANSVRSHWVKEEAHTAEKMGTLVPIHIDDAEFPFGFRTIQSEDFTTWNGEFTHFPWQRLLLQIHSLVPERPALQPGTVKSNSSLFGGIFASL